MEQLVMGLVALVIAVLARRKEAFKLRWQPERPTWVAFGAGLLAFAFSASLLLVDGASIVGRIIHYGLIYVLCGVIIPWGDALLVERGTPGHMGLRRERLGLSLVLGLAVAGLMSPIILLEADLAAMDWGAFGKALIALAGAGGLFELFLYYGFIHLRLEKAFGTIPAILFTSAIYVLWHTGTQLPLEPDPWMAMVKLFGVGLMAQALFSITHNLLIIWPFFHAVGVMIDFTVNLNAVDVVSTRFPWAVGSLVLMAAVGVVLAVVYRGRFVLSD